MSDPEWEGLRVATIAEYEARQTEFHSKLYSKFVRQFGEQEAKNLIIAAMMHRNGVHDRRGNDGFAWACLICIGYQCVERFAKDHDLTIDYSQFHAFCKRNAKMFWKYNGDCDYIAMLAGKYTFLAKGGAP